VDPKLANIRKQPVGKQGACSACHLVHQGRGPKMWARELKAGADPMAGLCLSCHSKGAVAEKFQVGDHSHPLGRPLAALPDAVNLPGYSHDGVKSVKEKQGAVTCASCHDPHQWDPMDPKHGSRPGDKGDATNKFLRKPNGSNVALCATCHGDKVDTVKGTKHDLAVMAPEEANAKGQRVEQAGVCSACHLVHNGSGPKMWARERPSGTDPISSTCLSCHKDKGPAHKKTIDGHSHPVAVPIENIGIRATLERWISQFRGFVGPKSMQRLPLFDGLGGRVPEGGDVTCATCHDPHKWTPVPGADAHADPKKVEGNGSSSFLRLANDRASSLCVNCHRDKTSVALSKHNLEISAAEEKNALGQTLKESGTCGACHLPHNGKGAKMWARNVSNTGQGIERLCVSCHQEGSIGKDKLTGQNTHPLHVSLGEIAGHTKLPLFRKDGSRDDKAGEVDCASCHNPHQWDPHDPASKAGAKADVDGDAHTSFLREAAAPDGALCGECHKQKQLVAQTEHDLAVTAPEARNGAGQTVAHSGVCGQCHSVHNAPMALRLWTRKPGGGEDAMETLCRSCHDQGEVAHAKVPAKLTHPKRLVPANAGRLREGATAASNPPVFDVEGKKVPVGHINCITCHDPHQWDPHQAQPGPGKNVEGNVLNSFLRSADTEHFLCADCHGTDSLFRYKYFHWDKSRVKHHLYGE